MKNILFTNLLFFLMSVCLFAQKTEISAGEFSNDFRKHVCGGHHHTVVDDTPPPPPPPPPSVELKNGAMIDAPTNITFDKESPNHIRLSWDAPTGCADCIYVALLDNDNNVNNGYYHYMVVEASTTPQLTKNTFNGSFTLDIGEDFKVYMQTVQNGVNSAWSAPVTTSFGWDNIGNPNNDITYTFEGFTSTEEATLTTFVNRVKPIIHNIYGPPARSINVKIVNKLNFQQYREQVNEIWIDKDKIFNQRRFHLFVHEMLHSWRDNAVLAVDTNWNYDGVYSGYEEGFAETGANDCMNEYIRLYPNDHDLSGNPSALNKTMIFNSAAEWNYDYRNQNALSTGTMLYTSTFDVLNRGLSSTRYYTAAAALKKIQVEHSTFYKDFNIEYYSRLAADHTLTVSKALLIDIVATVAPTIEGLPAQQWLDKQMVLACETIVGEKIFTNTYNTGTSILDYYHYYRTFDNGWDYEGDPSLISSFTYANGTSGTGKIYNSNNQLLKSFTPVISHLNGYGTFWLRLGSFALDSPNPHSLDWGEPTSLGLYKVEMTFGGATRTDYRVVGTSLSTNGIFGGVINGNGGQIYIDHEDFADENPLQIVNGAFYGTRSWASIPNSDTGVADSAPGQLTVRYIDDSGNEYITYKNIDLGSSTGGQMFLFDVNDMIPTMYCSPDVPINSNNIHISNVRLEQINNTSSNEGYADFTQNINTGGVAANLLPSSTHTLIVQKPSTPGVSTYWKAWIDYNQNNVFDDTESIMYKSNELNNSITHNFTVPTDALNGTTRMRVHLKQWTGGIPVPCGNNDNVDAEIEDYTVIIGTPCPDADNDGVCDVNDVCPNFDDNLIGTACDDGNPNTTSDIIQPNCTCQGTPIGSSDYCIPSITTTTNNYITGVVLAGGGISNGSVNDGGYRDFTTDVAPGNILPSETYTLNLYKALDNNADMYWRVWIDYNQDGVFDDNTEVALYGSQVSDNIFSGSITVPANALNGTTRMRVYLKRWVGAVPVPCGNSDTEERDVEDYAITIGEDDCQPFYDLSGTINTNVFKAQDYIKSTGQVPAGNTVSFQAGNLVHLKPGFIATAGTSSMFHAFIDDCTPTAPKEEIVETEPAIRNYPNPFTGQTTIEFTLPEDSAVTLFVSDAMGRQVAVLMNHQTSIAGTHQVIFDGNQYAAGMYYYTLQAGEYNSTQKMILIKP